jgi:hypothetical protein
MVMVIVRLLLGENHRLRGWKLSRQTIEIEGGPVLWKQHKMADGQTGLIYTRWIKQGREACELSPMLQASSDRLLSCLCILGPKSARAR